MANSRNYRYPTIDDDPNVPVWMDRLASDVAADVDKVDARAPQVMPALDAAWSITDQDGRRSWVEATGAGRPTSHTVDLLMDALGTPLGDAIKDTLTMPESIGPDAPAAWSITDQDGRRSWVEANNAGRPTSHTVALLAPALQPAMDARVSAAPARTPNVVEIAAGTLYVNESATGKRHLVTAAGNPRNATATVDSHVLFETDAGLVHSAVPSAGVYPLLPAKSLAFFGDSLTDSGPADTYPARVGAVTGLPYYQGGIAGQGSSDIAVRQGGLVPLVTVAGGTIPASGAVAVTVTPADGWRVNGAGTFSFGGTLAGVAGTLAHDLVANTWAFTRTAAGDATLAPAGTPFLVTAGAAHENKIQILWAGRNNVSAPNSLEYTRRDLLLMTSYLKPYVKRYLVLSVTNGKSEGRNSAAWTAITAHNQWLADTYGARFYDLRRDFIDKGLAMAGIAPTAADTTAINNDAPPPSLMADELHPNDAGATVIGDLVAAQLTLKGWT